MSNWQPIETAPRDGTLILAWNAAHGDIYVVGWKWADLDDPEGEDHWDNVGSKNAAPSLYFNDRYFQKWMPLPEPPAHKR